MTYNFTIFFGVGVSTCAAIISGCGVIHSSKITDTARSNIGIHYMLPQSNIAYQVVNSGTGELRLNLLNPITMGDPKQSYSLQYLSKPTSSDNVKIEVDTKTSLLKTVTIESKDETGEILKTIAANIIRAESSEGDQGTVILEGVVVPQCDSTVEIKNLDSTNKISQYLKNKVELCTKALRANNSALEINICDSYKAIQTQAQNTTRGSTSLEVSVTALHGAPTQSSDSITEVNGIFHRGVVPQMVKASFLGITRETIVLLPDCGPIISLPLEGQPFVKVKHTLVLKDGVVQSYEADKPSSALAIVSWPLDVYDAIVESTSKIIQLKIDTSRKSVELERQLLEEAKAKKDINDQLAQLKNESKPEASGLISQGKNSNLLLTVKAGYNNYKNIFPQLPTINSNDKNPAPAINNTKITSDGLITPAENGSIGRQK